MNPKLTPLELQLQQYAPEIFVLYMLMKDVAEGGGGQRNLRLLIDAIIKFHQTKATGSLIMDINKGKINHIDSRVRITADTSLTK